MIGQRLMGFTQRYQSGYQLCMGFCRDRMRVLNRCGIAQRWPQVPDACVAVSVKLIGWEWSA